MSVEAILDLLPVGVVLLEAKGHGLRVRSTNARAHAVFVRGDGLVLVGEALMASDPIFDERLQRALREVLARAPGDENPLRLEIELASGGRLSLHLRAAGPTSAGRHFVCLSIVEQRPVQSAAFDGLSPRRREVLEALLAGERPHDIARSLGLSEHTVRAYVKDLHRHFGAHSRGELLARFIPTRSA